MSEKGKGKRRIFTVETPLEYQVFLTRDRWREIVRKKHPALAGHEKDVHACLESPVLVKESSKDPDTHLYYPVHEGKYICVVVAPASETERFVVTAYFAETIKKGNKLWPS